MEEAQNPQQDEMNNGGAKISTSSYLCRQSSTRWTPTTEQIKLLKELYYINGVRSPSADQIQNICSRLRRYGKIEGKNVFYWFQNHKARERQKKRFTPNVPNANIIPHSAPQYHQNNNNLIINGGFHWKQDQELSVHSKYPSHNNPAGVSSSSSSVGVFSGSGQLAGSYGYGAAAMENNFRECSITGGVLNNGNVNQNSQWTSSNYNPYASPACCSNFLDKMSSFEEDNYEQDDHDIAPEIETLPLFPMHNDNHQHDHQGFYNFKPGSDGGYYTGGYRWSNVNNGSTSLELSLNSHGYGCYSPNP